MRRFPTSLHRPIRPLFVRIGLVGAVLSGVLALTPGISPAFGGGLGSGPGVSNHPVGIVPSLAVTIPAGWPLDKNGAITCLTCHTRIPSSSGESGPALREHKAKPAEPEVFCATCHNRSEFLDARSMHWLALGVAHVQADHGDSSTGGEILDSQTRQCLTCHDGATASVSKNDTPWTNSSTGHGDSRRNHPVGVKYDALSRPKDLTPLRPASLLPEEIVLPGGRVACVSCHDLYTSEPHLLTVPIYGSELCLTCHDMK